MKLAFNKNKDGKTAPPSPPTETPAAAESTTPETSQSTQKTTPQPELKKEQPSTTPVPKKDLPTREQSSNREDDSKKLLSYMSQNKKKEIIPFINFKENRVSFPILNDIGMNEYDVKFLESLSTEAVGILEKRVYERQVVCPKHPDELATGLRLYCPDCSSMDVERLHLIEHKVCGFIAEKEKYGVEDVRQVQKCPHCKKQIEDYNKEIRLPGRWNRCNSCTKIFDNVVVKLHCRKFAHDFDVTEAETVAIPSYAVKESALEQVGIMTILAPLKKILTSIGYTVDELAKVKGNSGVEHSTSLYAHNSQNKTIVVFIKSAKDEIADAEINETLVKVLDIAPTMTVFVAIPSVSDAATSVAESHRMNVVQGKSQEEILPKVQSLLSQNAQTMTASSTEVTEDPNKLHKIE